MNNATNDAAEILDSEFGDDLEYQEMLSAERLNSQIEKAVYDARTSGELTQEELTKEKQSVRVSALLRQWQQEYGLPPRPDGKSHTSVQELLAQWDSEDVAQMPEEVGAERRLWEESWKDHQEVTI